MNDHNDFDDEPMCNHDLAMKQISAMRKRANIRIARVTEIRDNLIEQFGNKRSALVLRFRDDSLDELTAECTGFITAPDGRSERLEFYVSSTQQFAKRFPEACSHVWAMDIAKQITGRLNSLLESPEPLTISLALDVKVPWHMSNNPKMSIGWASYLINLAARKA